MSNKEINRRKVLSSVMRKAWNIYHSGVQWHYTFSSCLKLAWKLISGIAKIKYTKVRGVTFTNQNGITRQQILYRLSKYPTNQISLFIKHESTNLYDSHAIQVHAKVRGSSIQIGYLSRQQSNNIFLQTNSLDNIIVVMDSITQSKNSHHNLLGCNLYYVI